MHSFYKFPATIIHPDRVRVKPNPANLLTLAGLKATHRPLSGVKGSLLSCLFAGVLSGELPIFTKCCSLNSV